MALFPRFITNTLLYGSTSLMPSQTAEWQGVPCRERLAHFSFSYPRRQNTQPLQTQLLSSSHALSFSLSRLSLVRQNLCSNLCSRLSLFIAVLCLSISPFYSHHAFQPLIISFHLLLHDAIFYSLSLFYVFIVSAFSVWLVSLYNFPLPPLLSPWL